MAGHGVEATGEATHWYSCPRPVLKREAVPALPANAVEGWLSQTPLDLETPASHSACMHPLETREPSHSHCLLGVYPTKTARRESRRAGHQCEFQQLMRLSRHCDFQSMPVRSLLCPSVLEVAESIFPGDLVHGLQIPQRWRGHV